MSAYLPPFVIDVNVRKRGARSFRMWLPLFLLWPLLLILVLPVLLITVITDLVLLAAGARYHHYTPLLLGAIRLLGEIRGTHVDAVSGDDLVKIDIY